MIENIKGVKWALGALRVNADDYALAAAYYDGRHRLAFATDKFRNHFGKLFRELSINHCAVCVDVPADRLQIEGFGVVVQKESDEDETAITKVDEIWRRNRMNKRAGEVHLEALKTGDAYVVVDWINDQATIFPNQAGRCAVQYDEENPGVVKVAAKWWPVAEGKKFRVRLNLYYPDRVEKYITPLRTYSTLPEREAEFGQIDGDWNIKHAFGKVPVFHFANNADIGSRGKGEVKPVIPPQDGLNKAVCDALVAAEFAALGQRYVTGLEIPADANGNPIAPFQDGLAKLWVAPPVKDENGKVLPGNEAQPITFGQFAAANMDQLIAMKEAFRKDISLISGVPSHYFMETQGGWPSGEALKTSEQRLRSKVADRQIAFGNVWEDVMRFCLKIEGTADVSLQAKWKETGPISEKDSVENAAVMVEKLGFPRREAWKTLGYKDSQIDTLEEQLNDQNIQTINRANTVTVPTLARNTTQGDKAA